MKECDECGRAVANWHWEPDAGMCDECDEDNKAAMLAIFTTPPQD